MGNRVRLRRGRDRRQHHLRLFRGPLLPRRRIRVGTGRAGRRRPARQPPGLLRPRRRRAPQGEPLARRRSGGAQVAGPHRAGRVPAGSPGVCARHRHPARPGARRRARAPPRGRHHALGPEVGLARGAAAGAGQCARAPRPQRGGAGNARLHRDAASEDPAVGPHPRALGAGECAVPGGGDLPPRDEPQQRPAAAHALRDCEHDPQRRAVAKRGDWPPSPLRAAHRRLLPQRARAGSSQGGLRTEAVDDWPHPRLRDCGLAEGGAGGVLEPPARHPRLHPREGLALRCAHRAGRDPCDAQTQAGAAPRGAPGAVDRVRARAGTRQGEAPHGRGAQSCARDGARDCLAGRRADGRARIGVSPSRGAGARARALAGPV